MKSLKYLLVAMFIISIFSLPVLAQGHDHMNMNHSKMEMKKDTVKTADIVHEEALIDLKAIDKNKDGKVFQDMMDWNVISDKPGKCPLCKMTLKEVTLDEAKKNLQNHGYKVK